MDSAAPTIFALETDSAWIVILAVSLVTLIAALALRKIVARPGGLASGLLLTLPLALPLVAAIAYRRSVLPEIAILKPAGTALSERTGTLLHLLMLNDPDGGTITFYALTGSAGPWLVLFGISVTSFMLVRRALGTVLVHRLIRRCRPLEDPDAVEATVQDLVRRSSLKHPPDVLLLPSGVSGAFAVGARRGRILISADLLDALEDDELEAILAHEVAHLESRDVPVIFIAGLLRDLVAWNPLAHIAFRRLSADREREADRRAAAITKNPLAVASGLLKMCELVKRGRGLGQKVAVAAFRPGSRISRRITDLIAVADGRASVVSAGRFPFLVSGLLVALLGLQAGARLASDQPGALAIVWGAPSSAAGEIWDAPKRISKEAERSRLLKKRAKARLKAEALPNLGGFPALAGGVRVLESDVDKWMRVVEQRMERVGLRTATIRWEARQDWQAVPIGEFLGSSVSLYRIKQLY
ncbi:MAG: M56 family metallopeptidase [Actinomycetota bacterium]